MSDDGIMDKPEKPYTNKLTELREMVSKDSNTTSPPHRSVFASQSQPCFKMGKGEYKHPNSIQIILNRGKTVKSMEYMHLRDKHYERGVGIILFYSSATITIYGLHLDDLYENLNNRRIAAISIYEGDTLHDHNTLNDNKEIAIITDIEVAYEDEKTEQKIQRLQKNGYSQKGR